ncbi:MAG: tetratricopeptide repeat protein [Candidatus Obscuribacterales bacterium]|nr:tetratricopeptide repeat protein [Candidatus Obscuribacterales bacterium]
MRLKGHVTSSVTILLASAGNAYQAGNLTQAAEYYKQVLQQDPHNVEALDCVGNLAERSGEFEQALFFYRLAAINDPSNPEYRLSASRILQRLIPATVRIKDVSVPVIPISQQLPCPSLCIANQKNVSRASTFFRTATKVGAAALVSSGAAGRLGIGCPICRFLH